MEAVKEFGVEPQLLIAQIVNFAVILYVLKRFAYKPILEVLKKREEDIKQTEKNNLLSEKALEKATEKEAQILRKASVEARQILDDAQKKANEISENARMEAAEQTKKMISDARNQINDEVNKAQKELAGQTSRVAISIMNKALEGMFDKSDNKKFIEQADKKISKIN